MYRSCLLALFTGMLVLSGGLVGQDNKAKEEPKKDVKKDVKNEPPTKAKGTLPPNWKKIGLTDTQVQDIYKVQNKYNDEIDKLEAKIKELKSSRDKEMKAVLTPEQKKRLDEILTGKDK
jgi:peptidoglycan hydrolase CwlO-like protein